MEINPYHPVMRHLKDKTKDSPDDESLINIAKLLYDSSIMASGFNVAETSDFSKRIYQIVAKGLGVDPNAEVPEEVVEAEEEEEEEAEEEAEDEAPTETPKHEEL